MEYLFTYGLVSNRAYETVYGGVDRVQEKVEAGVYIVKRYVPVYVNTSL